jgi:hypothetical protein
VAPTITADRINVSPGHARGAQAGSVRHMETVVMATRFQGLKQTLWMWTREALDRLEDAEPFDFPFLPDWARHSNGIFRYGERRRGIWPPEVDLEQLPSWRAVLEAISEEPDLARQFDQTFGTASVLPPWSRERWAFMCCQNRMRLTEQTRYSRSAIKNSRSFYSRSGSAASRSGHCLA